MILAAKIENIGSDGQGIVKIEKEVLSVPFTLPGEDIHMIRHAPHKATMIALKTSSQQRIKAICKHFEECGGCILQHWKNEYYQEWKTKQVLEILQGSGFKNLEQKVAKLYSCSPFTRRIITLTVRTNKKGQVVGFNRYHDHENISIEECFVVHPVIIENLSILKELARILYRAKTFQIKVTLVENGLDIAFLNCTHFSESERLLLIKKVLGLNKNLQTKILRITVNDEIIVEQQVPYINFGNIAVHLPPGGFLQATKQSESFMADLAVEGLKKCKSVLELFSGFGSFSFSLAQHMNVHAVENDKKAIASLNHAIHKNPGKFKKITTEQRDLFRRPFLARELTAYDGVLFDPPRAGAEKQAQEIAKSEVKYVVAVSCNPVTLARDLKILAKGGYQLEKIFPIDQFLWSPHCEVVVFLKKIPRKTTWSL